MVLNNFNGESIRQRTSIGNRLWYENTLPHDVICHKELELRYDIISYMVNVMSYRCSISLERMFISINRSKRPDATADEINTTQGPIRLYWRDGDNSPIDYFRGHRHPKFNIMAVLHQIAKYDRSTWPLGICIFNGDIIFLLEDEDEGLKVGLKGV